MDLWRVGSWQPTDACCGPSDSRRSARARRPAFRRRPIAPPVPGPFRTGTSLRSASRPSAAGSRARFWDREFVTLRARRRRSAPPGSADRLSPGIRRILHAAVARRWRGLEQWLPPSPAPAPGRSFVPRNRRFDREPVPPVIRKGRAVGARSRKSHFAPKLHLGQVQGLGDRHRLRRGGASLLRARSPPIVAAAPNASAATASLLRPERRIGADPASLRTAENPHRFDIGPRRSLRRPAGWRPQDRTPDSSLRPGVAPPWSRVGPA